METAEKCCQANAQFAEISEVTSELLDDTRAGRSIADSHRVLPLPLWDSRWENKVEQIKRLGMNPSSDSESTLASQ